MTSQYTLTDDSLVMMTVCSHATNFQCTYSSKKHKIKQHLAVIFICIYHISNPQRDTKEVYCDNKQIKV